MIIQSLGRHMIKYHALQVILLKLITIYTEKHEDLLQGFQKNTFMVIRGQGYMGPLFYTRLAYNPKELLFAEGLTHFMEDIVLYDNPVYRYSPKLREAAHQIRCSPVHIEIRDQLRQYLKQNKTLHIEGYAAFRMDAYKWKLDMLMFGLIKKLKLYQLT